MSGHPSVVVFDIGEVLVDWNPRYLYDNFFDAPEQCDYFLSTVCDADWNRRADAGEDWDDLLQERIALYPQYEGAILAYRERWMDMVRGTVAGSVDVLERLKSAAVPVYAITNYNDHTFAMSQEKYPCLTLFDGVVVSGAEKITKPDHQIYHTLYARYDLSPEACIFIDDRQDNIDAALETGMRGILFQNPSQMRADLVACGFDCVAA
jgi:2-haloacid dehalogenase